MTVKNKKERKTNEKTYFVPLLLPALNDVPNAFSLLHVFHRFSVQKSVDAWVFLAIVDEVALLGSIDDRLEVVEKVLRAFMVRSEHIALRLNVSQEKT